MSESIGSDPNTRFNIEPHPSGPVTGTLSAGTAGASTIRTRASDGSITTAVVAALGDIVALTTTRPDHPLSIEA